MLAIPRSDGEFRCKEMKMSDIGADHAGILEVRLPLHEKQAKSTRIEVQRA